MPDFNIIPLTDLPLNTELDQILEFANAPEDPRPYLGASIIGEDCARKIQLEWWCRPATPAKLKRIFARGHYFEAYVRAQLTEAGFRFSEQPANIEFIALDGYFKGHADGLIIDAPALPTAKLALPCVWECKALNAKNWRAVVKDGLAKTFPKYAAQVATYQLHLGQKNPALFTACNCDDCKLVHFAVPFNVEAANYWTDRARMIINATRAGELLSRFTNNPDDWRCKSCPHRENAGAWNHDRFNQGR